jgi:hypothetical protein
MLVFINKIQTRYIQIYIHTYIHTYICKKYIAYILRTHYKILLSNFAGVSEVTGSLISWYSSRVLLEDMKSITKICTYTHNYVY